MPVTDDLVALRLLTLIAETGSIGAAGAHLGMTQQAASARTRQLETSLAMPLLLRSPRGSTLTDSGRLVAGWAAELLGASERFERATASLREHGRNGIRVAASLTVAEHLVPRWIARLGPGLRLELLAENSTAVAARVRRDDVELGFIETPDVPGDLRSRTFATDELVVVVAPGHPWAATGSIEPLALVSTGLMMREEGSGTRLAAERMLADAAGPLHLSPAEPAGVLPTSAAIRSAVAAGVAPSVLSILAVRDDLDAGRLVRVAVDGVRAIRPLSVIWSARHPLSTAAERLLAVIE